MGGSIGIWSIILLLNAGWTPANRGISGGRDRRDDECTDDSGAVVRPFLVAVLFGELEFIIVGLYDMKG
jgi:hypothetical protein